MKICAFSDTHGNLDGLDIKDADIVVIAGDIAPLRNFKKFDIYDQKKWFAEKFIPWTQSHKEVEFIITPGNHDLCLDPNRISHLENIDWRIDWPSNVHLLINSGVEVNGLKFWGSPNVPTISNCWAYESDHEKLKEVFNKIPSNLDILVTHTPPHYPDSTVDRSLQYGGYEAFGSSELAQAIFDKKPKYLFCGHIHSGKHGAVKFEDTTIYNVSRVDEAYEIAYEPTVIEL